jgi:hypothetical protein
MVPVNLLAQRLVECLRSGLVLGLSLRGVLGPTSLVVGAGGGRLSALRPPCRSRAGEVDSRLCRPGMSLGRFHDCSARRLTRTCPLDCRWFAKLVPKPSISLDLAKMEKDKTRRFQRVSQWARLGSNQRPPACEAGALPLSYAPWGLRLAAAMLRLPGRARRGASGSLNPQSASAGPNSLSRGHRSRHGPAS